jgi:hypothetical protein
MDEKDNGGDRVSLKKLEANRRNAQLSTGPRTETGKNHSRRNARRHGVLASALLVTEGPVARDRAEFYALLEGLRNDLMPDGTLEEMFTEKIAVCWWRQKRALECELRIVPHAITGDDSEEMLDNFRSWQSADRISRILGAQMDRILRYETTIQRELVYSLNQLERLQRARRGEHVPAPVGRPQWESPST